jgi:antitoxin component of MazEF toxin-antitoxin module
MTEVDAVVRKAGNSIDLRVAKSEARRLGLKEGRHLRIHIEDVKEVAELVGVLKGRVSAKALHAATNEDEDLG